MLRCARNHTLGVTHHFYMQVTRKHLEHSQTSRCSLGHGLGYVLWPSGELLLEHSWVSLFQVTGGPSPPCVARLWKLVSVHVAEPLQLPQLSCSRSLSKWTVDSGNHPPSPDIFYPLRHRQGNPFLLALYVL